MCNLFRTEQAPDAIARVVREMGRQLVFPDGIPNMAPRDVRITERAAILRARSGDPLTFELVERRWSWPGAGGKPVFNFRSEGRRFGAGRCLILADAFYEFAAPDDPGRRAKQRWRFDWAGNAWFAIAGIVRDDPAVGEAFTMLTCEPGPDVAPYHGRQVVVLSAADSVRWLEPGSDERLLLRPPAAGSLSVQRD